MSPSEVIAWLNRIFWHWEYEIYIKENPEPSVIKALYAEPCYRIKQSRLNGVLARVPIKKHRIYHKLFANMTPSEIVDWLNQKYWGNKCEIYIREKII